MPLFVEWSLLNRSSKSAFCLRSKFSNAERQTSLQKITMPGNSLVFKTRMDESFISFGLFIRSVFHESDDLRLREEINFFQIHICVTLVVLIKHFLFSVPCVPCTLYPGKWTTTISALMNQQIIGLNSGSPDQNFQSCMHALAFFPQNVRLSSGTVRYSIF